MLKKEEEPMHDVQIDDQVWRVLGKMTVSFDDTPNKVLRRLLRIDDAPVASRAEFGELFPEPDYFDPILRSLHARGGKARVKDIIDDVGTEVSDRLTPKDRELLPSGTEIRWRNRVAFARLRMVKQGLLESNAPRGYWKISAKGRRRLGT